MRAEILRVMAGIDAEIKRFIAAHVGGEIDNPAVKMKAGKTKSAKVNPAQRECEKSCYAG